MSVRMIECLLCGKLKPHKSRYLCLACYQNPASKKLKIPTQFRVDRDNLELAHRVPASPAKNPTQAKPGSQEKIAVMQERYEKNQHIHHPEDAKIVPDEMGDEKNFRNSVDNEPLE